ncbi:nuclear transport factor 2 family protein [Sediminitomix flava]|uniref:Putative SnoaL-like aldol condensation-catalyzing enzyme n=1 Tax=Sediminitomix flava TaxID=379075 RepID=A0A315ZED1_SEDFL|nr:nuclear transport factor 2 family protein [Sediminitomix flava]PWJ43891.1 putative SnoaL-like aldol condensation-catalyzing enzyme [Sediminitomix flava]
MSQKIENAKGLYLEGIRDGNAREAVTKYTGDRYTQHSTGVADGVEGFVAFFEPFIERNKNRDIQIVRSFEDGEYVFTHAYQNIDNGKAQWVTADIFHTDSNDKIIEHWDVIQAFEKETASGRTMVDGPTEIVDLDKTNTNKALVKKFLEEVLVKGKGEKLTDFISTEKYYQHSPTVGDGVEGLVAHIKDFQKKGIKASYEKVHKLIGQGNFVVSLSHARLNEKDFAYIDIFRLEDGLIVEHWDVQEEILPKEQWGNSGKF